MCARHAALLPLLLCCSSCRALLRVTAPWAQTLLLPLQVLLLLPPLLLPLLPHLLLLPLLLLSPALHCRTLCLCSLRPTARSAGTAVLCRRW